MKSKNRPCLFIASSSESIDAVNEMNCLLDRDAWVTPWNLLFDMGDLTLQRLIEALEDYDFAAFIFAPDDLVMIRKRTQTAVRDNVLFELGLFMGRIGRKRTFIVMPRGIQDFRLPTDLLSVKPVTYEPNRPDGELSRALNPACTEIRKAMKRLGPIQSDRRHRKSLREHKKGVTRLLGGDVTIPAVQMPKTKAPTSKAPAVARRKIRIVTASDLQDLTRG